MPHCMKWGIVPSGSGSGHPHTYTLLVLGVETGIVEAMSGLVQGACVSWGGAAGFLPFGLSMQRWGFPIWVDPAEMGYLWGF